LFCFGEYATLSGSYLRNFVIHMTSDDTSKACGCIYCRNRMTLTLLMQLKCEHRHTCRLRDPRTSNTWPARQHCVQ